MITRSYQNAVAYVINGSKYAIDFKKKKLYIDGNLFLDKDNILDDFRYLETIDPYDRLDELYMDYYNSIPSTRKSKELFQHKSDDELTAEDFRIGLNRYIAQAKLEIFILCAGLTGLLKPKTDGWFYKHPTNNWVLLYKWIRGE